MADHEESVVVESDYQCGIQSKFFCCPNKNFKSRLLQKFASPRWTLAFFSFAGLLQGFVVHGLLRVIVSTLERRFGLKSAETAWIISVYDGASLVTIPVVTFFGSKGNKAQWIGCGTLLVSAGCFVFALPHFAAPAYVVQESNGNQMLCSVNSSQQTLGDNRNYRFVFVFANILNGCGSSAIFTLGMTYLDENVAQKVSSIYHGIYYAAALAVGPATGYVLGGLSLNLFTNIGQSVQITSSNASWVGAWWIGFLLGGILIFLAAVPILLLPRKLPSSLKLTGRRNAEVDRSLQNPEDDSGSSPKSFLTQAKLILPLLTNIPLLTTALANALDYGFLVGFSPFAPKYIESMFGLTATQASIYLGIVSITGATIGLIAGGVVVSKAHMDVRQIFQFCVVNTLLAIICDFSLLVRCSEREFAGSTVPYSQSQSTSTTNFTSSCNQNCGCNSDMYNPVCGSNGITYFSACYAGCKEGGENQTFSECSCVNGLPATAHRGTCPLPYCNGLPIFLTIVFLLMVFHFMSWTPNLQAVVRIVPFDQRSLAVGVQWIFNRMLGIPFPLIVGSVLDRTCSVWSTEDGKTASCRHYFNAQMSLYFFLFVLSCKVCVLLCYSVDLVVYRPKTGKRERSHVETDEDVL